MPIVTIVRLVKKVLGFAEEEAEMAIIGNDPEKIRSKLASLDQEIEQAQQHLAVEEHSGRNLRIRKAQQALQHLQNQKTAYQNKLNEIQQGA